MGEVSDEVVEVTVVEKSPEAGRGKLAQRKMRRKDAAEGSGDGLVMWERFLPKISLRGPVRSSSAKLSSEECQTSDWSSGHQRKCRDIGITTLAPSARNGPRLRASTERDQNKISFKPR
ncbi:hypothetical protein HA466_0251970 [Hirschfeldia incana]|nr:hypothetical protein HA466_0251970 [Hirschfeldia incana]